MRHLLIRADASSQIGIGHMMRCLALGQAWQDEGGQVTFAMASDVRALMARLKAEGMRVAWLDVQAGSADDSEQTIKLAHELGARWVVVDGYHFTSDYQWAIKDSGLDLLFVDDNGDAGHYYADIVLNQNIHAENLSYSCEPYSKLLLGTRYVLLRREFLKWRGWKREIPDVARKILVTLGGADPENVTLKVIQALQKVDIPDIEVKVIIGPSNPNRITIESELHLSPFTFHLLSSVENMPELMAWADIAVSAGGSTSWELCFMGLPAIILCIAPQQETNARSLLGQRIIGEVIAEENVDSRHLCWGIDRLSQDSETRRVLSINAQSLTNGLGARKVTSLLSHPTIR